MLSSMYLSGRSARIMQLFSTALRALHGLDPTGDYVVNVLRFR